MTEPESPEPAAEPPGRPGTFHPRALLRRSAVIFLFSLIGFWLVCAVMLYFGQRGMMYFPRQYEPVWERGLPPGTRVIEHAPLGVGAKAFYIPPAEAPDAQPDRVWVFFHGNASTALDWLDFVESLPPSRTGYLLVDYPGYGLSEGKPTREGIIAAGETAWAALARELDVDPAGSEVEVNTLGFSMGAAAAAEFAVRHPVENVVLMAPFTSTMEIANKMVTPVLSWVLVERYDNEARLRDLLSRADPPEITIIHGTDDEVIPFDMGRRLGALDERITFHPIEGGSHNWLLEMADAEVRAALGN